MSAAKRSSVDLAGPWAVAGDEVLPGQHRQLELRLADLPTRSPLTVPVTVVNGRRPGPRLFVLAALHGDELNGIDVVRRLMPYFNADRLRGGVVAIPIVNVFGFLQQERTLPDGRDLNRSFPGSRNGPLASRLAHLLMREVVQRCTHGLDLHTATRHRTNVPQIRADLDDAETLAIGKAFGTRFLLHARLRDGSLREAAARKGIPILVYEAGEALRFEEHAIRAGLRGVLGVMTHLGMLRRKPKTRTTDPHVLRGSSWIRAKIGGLLRSEVQLGQRVEKGEVLGTVADPFGTNSVPVQALEPGWVIGFSRNPVVYQGDALFHVAQGVDDDK